nr:hypothetical protein [Tanacetum cinerariifolium]
MSTITDIRCALTQKAFNAFCAKYHILEEVHPVLPNQNDTIHERPAGKIGLYTRFFDYANFRLPLSSFLVDILRHFRINISQRSVIGAAKVSHFEILCRVYEIVPTVGLFRCFYVNFKKNRWISFSKHSFAYPALFPWHAAKNVTRDPAPVAAAAITLWMRKLILGSCIRIERVDIDLFAFIHAPDPTKVKIVGRERVGNEPLLLQTTVCRTVPLLPFAHDSAVSELETSIDKLFDEGGSSSQAVQRGSVGVGEGTNIQPVIEVTDIFTEDEDHGTLSGPPTAGKSMFVVHRLLDRAVLNAEVRGDHIPTFPFVTSSVSTTLEREGGDHTDSVTGLNLRTISAPKRFFISSDSSHHSGANVAEAEVDSLVRSSVPVMITVTTTTPTADHAVLLKRKLISLLCLLPILLSLVELILMLVVTNGSYLDDGRVCREMVDEFSPPKFFAFVRGMEHDQLCTEFNVGAARQMSLSAKLRMRAEYNIREKRRLKSAVDDKDELLKAMDKWIENHKAQIVLKEAKAAESIRLRAEASNFVTVEKSLRDEVNALNGRNIILERKFQDAQLKVVNNKFDKLYADFVEVALRLGEMFYPHLLTTISGHRWLLTHGMELAISKCLNSSEYLSTLGAAIGKAIEKIMQDGLSAGITHGMEGRALTDDVAYNLYAEADYITAFQRLQSVNFSLLAELRSNKYSSIDIVMNILRLEETLAERLGLTELQPHVDQLMVPIHHSPDKTVVGATSLLFALDVFNVLERKIRKNIAGAGGTSDTVPATAIATTALSTTLASASTIVLIFVDDYVVAGTDDQAGADGNADPFPNVDDAELVTPPKITTQRNTTWSATS